MRQICWILLGVWAWGQGLLWAAPARNGIGIWSFQTSSVQSEWLGLFLQEELIYQIAQSRTFAWRSAEVIRRWEHSLHRSPGEALEESLLEPLQLHYGLTGEVQRVLRYTVVRGEFASRDPKEGFQKRAFEQKFKSLTPDEWLEALLQTLGTLDSRLAEVNYRPQNYTWEGLEAFYRWKLKPKPRPGSPEAKAYLEELTAFLSPYPELSRLIYMHQAALLLAEATGGSTIKGAALQQADSAMKQALVLDPEFDEARVLMAQIFYFAEDRFAAKAEAVIAHGHNPQNGLALILYGLSVGRTPEEGQAQIAQGLKLNPFVGQPTPEKALWPYEWNSRLLQETPKFQPPQPAAQRDHAVEALNAGLEAWQKKDWQSAQHLFSQALAADPQNHEAKLYLAKTHLAQGQTQEAIKLLEDLRSALPEREEASFQLGVLAEQQQQYPQAEELYREALSRRPESPEAMLRLGTVLIKMQRYPEAQSFLENLTRKHPSYSTGWWNLGLLYWRLQEWTAAKNAWENALREDPENPRIQEYLEKAKAKTP